MIARRSHLYICYRSDCHLAKIGDMFEDTPDGFIRVIRTAYRNDQTGQVAWNLRRSDPPLIIPDKSLRHYLLKVQRPLPESPGLMQ